MGRNGRNWHGSRGNKHQYQGNKHNKRPPYQKYNKNRQQNPGDDNKRPKPSKKEQLSLREDQVGITEYVGKCPGFIGVVKSRYSDFHVNEIDTNGKVLQFNDLTIPKQTEETLDEKELTEAQKEFNDIITPEVWKNIGVLAEMKRNNPDAQPIEINVTALDKEKRTKLHNMFKQLYGNKVVSSTISQTIDSKEERFVKIVKPKGNQGEKRTKWTFPGEYVHFLVYKENMDTSEAASKLASNMRIHPSKINYCGSKDKRAKTTQKFCIRRREPSAIVNAAQKSDIRVGNFEFSNEVLKLGDLKGNRFRIALRHVDGDEQEIEKALIHLRDHGFINFFGLQRFGNHPGTPTYEVGVALLKSDYKTVVELILRPRECDMNFMDEIRKFWWETRNSAAAAAMFRSKDFVEKKLLDGLAQYGEHDYASALRKIPRNMLLLYPHAFQSLVFNRVASRRIKQFGMQLIPGDLVYRNKEELDEDFVEKIKFQNMIEETGQVVDSVENAEESETVKETEKVVDIAKDEESETLKETGKTVDIAKDEESETFKETGKTVDSTKDEKSETVENVENTALDSVFKRQVKSLTEEDIASGEYTLYDVVLPLPGYDITYPANEVGTWYKDILAEYGLSSENLRHKVKTYALAGAYRRLLIRPTEFTWKFRKYTHPEETLIASDWEHLTGRNKTIETDKTAGTSQALLLDFYLPPSVYATMLVRELLKMDTSVSSQNEIENNELNKKNQVAGEQKAENSETSASGEKRKLDANMQEEVEEKKLKENDKEDPEKGVSELEAVEVKKSDDNTEEKSA